jgi:hemolysin activation/secretion protein
VRDNGWAASAEYRWRYGDFDVAFFGDAGAAQDSGQDSNYLKSVGWGLRWTPWPGVLLQLYKGYAMVEPETKGTDLQDRGYHFSAAVQRAF